MPEFNDHYDKTAAKGLCFQCGEHPVQRLICEKTGIVVDALWCEFCKAIKESMVFQGRVIYFCPEMASFIRYRDGGYGYWRRKGEQTQN